MTSVDEKPSTSRLDAPAGAASATSRLSPVGMIASMDAMTFWLDSLVEMAHVVPLLVALVGADPAMAEPTTSGAGVPDTAISLTGFTRNCTTCVAC